MPAHTRNSRQSLLGFVAKMPRVHWMRNALAYAGKTQRRIVSAWIGTAFALILLDDVVQVFALPQPGEAPQIARPLQLCHRFWIGWFLSTVMVRGVTACGCASALRKNRLAATASRRAESRKSMVWPTLSTARYR